MGSQRGLARWCSIYKRYSKGYLKIKCPFCHRNHASMHNIVIENKHFCLKQNLDSSFSLDHSHAYYYQMQTHMFVYEVEYVVCTFPADSKPVLHIKCIKTDAKFWSQCISKSKGVHSPWITREMVH